MSNKIDEFGLVAFVAPRAAIERWERECPEVEGGLFALEWFPPGGHEDAFARIGRAMARTFGGRAPDTQSEG